MPAFIPKIKIVNATGSGVWGSITGTLDDQSDLKAVLDGKAALSHTHTESQITDLDKYTQAQVDSLLAGKSAVGHTHVKADITDSDWISDITAELIESLQNVNLSVGGWANNELLVYSTASSALVNAALTKALISDFSDGDYATAAQGTLADSAVQPNDNISDLVNDAGYLTSFTESDPVFTASPANGITAQQITNWDVAFGWGNHASAGYLTSFTETDPVFSASPAGGITGTDVSNWNAAFSWGDHSLVGYALTSAIPTSILDLSDVEDPTPVNKDVLIYSSAASKYQFRQFLKDDISDFSDGDYATSAQGTLADTAVQPGDDVSDLVNNVGYLSSESDPIFVGSAAYTISSPMITQWNTAHGWGNHATAGYLNSNSLLNDLFDVNVGNPGAPQHGYAVLWDEPTSKFVLGEVALGSIETLDSIGDVNVGTPGAAEDGYSLIWDNATSRYILSAVAGGGGSSDHGALTGLLDDDHTQYALADGSRGSFATVAQGSAADTAFGWGDHAVAGYLTDAPSDGGLYGRVNGIWQLGNLYFVDKNNAQIVYGQKTFNDPTVFENNITQNQAVVNGRFLGVRTDTAYNALGHYVQCASSTQGYLLDLSYGLLFASSGPGSVPHRVEASRNPYGFGAYTHTKFHDWISREFDDGLNIYHTAKRHTVFGDFFIPNISLITGADKGLGNQLHGKRNQVWVDPANTGSALISVDITNVTLSQPEEFLVVVDNAATGACSIYRGISTHILTSPESATITGTPYVTAEGIAISFTNFHLLANGDRFGFRVYQKGRALIDKIDEATANAGVTIESVLIKDGLVDGKDLSLVSESQLAVDLAYQTTATINYTPEFPVDGVLVIECFFGAAQTEAGPVSAGLITIQ